MFITTHLTFTIYALNDKIFETISKSWQILIICSKIVSKKMFLETFFEKVFQWVSKCEMCFEMVNGFLLVQVLPVDITAI